MKTILSIILSLTLQGMFAQEDEVRKAIDIFYEGFHSRDTVKLWSVCKKEMLLHSVSVNKTGNEFTIENVSEFFKSIVSIPEKFKFEEKILSYNIQSDGVVAHVWTPYEFYVDGKLSHAGVNSFQLIKDHDAWEITYCIDTRRK